MTQQVINVGTAPNSGTGEGLRAAFTKCNQNFTDLYGTLGAGASPVQFSFINNASGGNVTGLNVGFSAIVFSTTTVTRSTVIQADDTYLRLLNVPGGVYEIAAAFNGQCSGTGGINWTNSFGWNSAGYGSITGNGVSGTVSGSGVFADWSYNGGATGWVGTNTFTGAGVNFNVTGTGVFQYSFNLPATVSLLWAQSVANGSTSVFGGMLRITRLS